MPRLMSFALTTQQILLRTKDVTRRLGWQMLKPGETIIAVDHSPRSQRGYSELAHLHIVSVTPERLNSITKEEVVREGFSHMTPEQFVTMFAKHMGCDPDTPVTRIEFRYDKPEGGE